MDKIVPNGQKIRVFGTGNSQSGQIQFSQNKLRISGNNVGNGVLISDGKLHLKSGGTTASIIYSNLNPVGVTVDNALNIKSGSNVITIGSTQNVPVISSTAYQLLRIARTSTGDYMSFFIFGVQPYGNYGGGGIGSLAFSTEDASQYVKYGYSYDGDWGRLLRENSDGKLSRPITTSTIKLQSLTAKTGAGNSLLCIDSSGLIGTTASVSGYVPSTRTLGIAGTTNQIVLNTGTQDLSANRSWTISLATNVTSSYASNSALLGGNAGSYFQNASNINAGTLGVSYLPTISIIKGGTNNATYTSGSFLAFNNTSIVSSPFNGSSFAPASLVHNNMQFVYTMYTQSINVGTFTITPDMLTGSLGLTTAAEVYLHVNVSSYISLNNYSFFSQDYPALLLQPQLGEPLLFESLEITPAASPPFTASVAVMFQVKQ